MRNLSEIISFFFILLYVIDVEIGSRFRVYRGGVYVVFFEVIYLLWIEEWEGIWERVRVYILRGRK